ncbi:DUF3558 domain-containing protein [Saccharomonospora piscinae]|uniref:DUF3558 domain-containing protein n=1 Tax=Saccharomonospora piscinae TaxID=687388 RepID=UPI0011066000|nr:DUF3558 domain-containing protein [Saccharomonospora piscinae]TLW93694.1 DUF3558 domain-containing protein [Saccharomonospora piscinae]
MKHFSAAIALVSVAALITGCSTPTSSGAPTPAVPTSIPTALSSESTAPRVPAVSDPLEIDALLDEPCSSLTADQIIEYLGENAETKRSESEIAGPSCSWHADMGSDAEIAVTYPQLTDDGLAALYRNSYKHAYFLEAPSVSGYPAISYGILDNRDKGECLITVGTSDSDYVNVDVYLGHHSVGRKDPCDAAHEVATDVIDNIKATD